jgi:hypothetical protein
VCCLSKFNQGIFFEALRQKRSGETLHARRRRLRLIQFWGVRAGAALAQISKFACDKRRERERGALVITKTPSSGLIDAASQNLMSLGPEPPSERESSRMIPLCCRSSQTVSSVLHHEQRQIGCDAFLEKFLSPIARKTNNAQSVRQGIFYVY